MTKTKQSWREKTAEAMDVHMKTITDDDAIRVLLRFRERVLYGNLLCSTAAEEETLP